MQVNKFKCTVQFLNLYAENNLYIGNKYGIAKLSLLMEFFLLQLTIEIKVKIFVCLFTSVTIFDTF